MMNKYVPIPCEVYGNYELAILRRSQMRFCWRARGGIIRVLSAVPVNIRTRNKGEYLILRGLNGSIYVLRLDRILRSGLLHARKPREVSYS